MFKKTMVMVLGLIFCLAGCATTRPAQRANVEKGLDLGLEASYWATYTAGKVLEIPKLATGGPAPTAVFDTGLKAILIPLGLAIKANKASKGKEKGNWADNTEEQRP